MAILKCKICGGDVETNKDMTLGLCQYCGSTITLPRIDEERRAEAFNRGNHYRRIGEFDNALSVYEQILNEDPDDAEAHWCAAISRFGIEYVEDPATMEYIPTCHRLSYESFLEDFDYLKALELSEGATKRQYIKEAAKISEVQNGILAKSQVEDPFDIFICYKESDESGRRTRDSVVAQEIYSKLIEAGYKTFFARITLEDKVGIEYEPYIFSALNTSKVMIVVGTSGQNLNSVWVKNEWSRFIALMKKDSGKVLLPCYLDMNPSAMPSELAVLQAYDISAMGFVQDLLRGVSKIITPIKTNTRVVADSSINTAANFIKRGMLSVEACEWKQAENYFEQALNADPESARAYWGKVLSERKAQNVSELLDTSGSLKSSENYSRALRFADPEFKRELQDCEKRIQKRLAIERKMRKRRGKVVLLLVATALLLCILLIGGVLFYKNVYLPSQAYKNACMQYDAGEYSQALLEFTELGNYKDALEWVEKCRIALYGEDWYEFIKTCKVGQEFSLGTYYSDAIKSEYTTSLNAGDIEKPEKSPIEWTIIKKENGRALAISTYIIDYEKILKGGPELCNNVEKELNSSFIQTCFNEDDLYRIVDNKDLANNITKRLFIPDKTVLESIPNDTRKGISTEYIKSVFEQFYSLKESDSYLIKTDNAQEMKYSFVDENGEFRLDYTIGSRNMIGIRPCIWIKLETP